MDILDISSTPGYLISGYLFLDSYGSFFWISLSGTSSQLVNIWISGGAGADHFKEGSDR